MAKRKYSCGDERDNGYVQIPIPTFEDDESDVGRVYDPFCFKRGTAILVFLLAAVGISLALKLPVKLVAAASLLPLILDVALLVFGTYQIHHDKNGFSERLFRRTLRRHGWETITAVTEDKRIYVNGRRLLIDTFSGYDAFYARARAACKKQGNRVPPQKEPKNPGRKTK